MEEQGLVERVIPKEDRRATYAHITAKGEEALLRAKPVHMDAVQQYWSDHIDDEQAQQLIAAFAAVLAGNGCEIKELSKPQ